MELGPGCGVPFLWSLIIAYRKNVAPINGSRLQQRVTFLAEYQSVLALSPKKSFAVRELGGWR